MSDNGKGSTRRPCQISKEEFDKNWERIFSEKKKKKEEENEKT